MLHFVVKNSRLLKKRRNPLEYPTETILMGADNQIFQVVKNNDCIELLVEHFYHMTSRLEVI